MLGAVGIDMASSAQSKCGGTGIKRGSTKLDGGSTRSRGCRTAVVVGLGAPAAVKDVGGGEAAHLPSSWGELGGTGGLLCLRLEFWGEWVCFIK
jgi:hypothetical protein